MSTSPVGDNVLLTYEDRIYTLSYSENEYQWEKIPLELSISRAKHIQFTVPASLISCPGTTTTTTTTTATPCFPTSDAFCEILVSNER